MVRVPDGGSNLWVGGADVSSSNGFAVLAGEILTFDVVAGDTLYMIADSATVQVQLLHNLS